MQNADGTVKEEYTQAASPVPGIGQLVETNRPGATPQKIYPVMDPRGTITKYLQGDGTTVVASREYDAFGGIIPNSGVSTWPGIFGYQGQAWTEVQSADGTQRLLLSPTRLYDPTDGRYLSRNPAGIIHPLRRFQAYQYAHQSPTLYADPLGILSRIVGVRCSSVGPRFQIPDPTSGWYQNDVGGLEIVRRALYYVGSWDPGFLPLANVFGSWDLATPTDPFTPFMPIPFLGTTPADQIEITYLNSPLNENFECGGLQWIRQWNLEPYPTGALVGVILQHVQVQFNYFDCWADDRFEPDSFKQDPVDFWEAFVVNPKNTLAFAIQGIGIDPAYDNIVIADLPSAVHPNHGDWFLKVDYAYFAGMTIPPNFSKPNPAASAGSATWASLTDPSLFDPRWKTPTSRWYQVAKLRNWYCCGS